MVEYECNCARRTDKGMDCIYAEERIIEGEFYQAGLGYHEHKESRIICLLKEKLAQIEDEETK